MGETLHSVGIDVGTSTTQLILSRLTVENRANAYAVPDFTIGDREILYRSPIHFTPLRSATELDAAGIRQIVAEEYRLAGSSPSGYPPAPSSSPGKLPGRKMPGQCWIA